MKRKFCLCLSLLLVFALIPSACTTTTSSNLLDTSKKLKVALVISDRLGDKSFFDAADAGLEKAKKELGIEARLYQCNSDTSVFSEKLTEASQYANVVIVVGYELYDLLKEMAKCYPQVNYIYVDSIIQGTGNITSLDYNEYEGAFLAGAAAALLTTDTSIAGINNEKIIGMIGGMDIPVIRDYEAGYKDGAKYIDPEVQVITVFSGDFRDKQKCKDWADILYQKDVDIIMVAAGGAGQGAFVSAGQYRRYIIGSDADQKSLRPDVVMASMTKEIGFSIYESIKKVQEGSFIPGKVYQYGLKENGIDLVYGDSQFVKIVPAQVKERIEAIRQGIIDGSIKKTAN